jgi:hypothetical protein
MKLIFALGCLLALLVAFYCFTAFQIAESNFRQDNAL